MLVLLFLSFDLAAFSISGENSHVVMIAISAAVAIIVLTVVTYVLVGRWVWLTEWLSIIVAFLSALTCFRIWRLWRDSEKSLKRFGCLYLTPFCFYCLSSFLLFLFLHQYWLNFEIMISTFLPSLCSLQSFSFTPHFAPCQIHGLYFFQLLLHICVYKIQYTICDT